MNDEKENARHHINEFNSINSSIKVNFQNSNIYKNIENNSINNSLAGQYIPTMILLQSIGIERTFEHPALVQNSLSNDLCTTTPNMDDDNSMKNVNTNIQHMQNDKYNTEICSSDKLVTNSIKHPNIIFQENSEISESLLQKGSDNHERSNTQKY